MYIFNDKLWFFTRRISQERRQLSYEDFFCENVYIFSQFGSLSGYLAHFNNVFILELSWLFQCITSRKLSIFVRVLNHWAFKGALKNKYSIFFILVEERSLEPYITMVITISIKTLFEQSKAEKVGTYPFTFNIS